jgi:hypothetical protein
LVSALLCWLAAGCSSSKSNQTSTTLHFTLPTSGPTVELSPAGIATVNLAVNQSVNWSLANSNGFGTPPPNATVSPLTGPTATFTYTAQVQPCTPGAITPVQIEVVATTTTTPPQTAVMPVIVVQSPPCLAALPISTFNQNFTSCPAAGSLLYGKPAGAFMQVGVFAQAPITAGAQSGVPFGVPPFTWTVTGALPPGLSLSPGADTSSVVLTGTPTSSACSTFQLQLKDAQNGVSCDPTVTTSCVPTTFSVLVIPPSLGVQVPPYSYSYDGVPYPPLAVLTSGGTPPYTWEQDPSGNSTLPPGLALSTKGSNPNYTIVSGTPTAGDSALSNGAGNGTAGAYPTLLQVNDSQTPYPAVGQVTLNIRDYVAPLACSTSAAPLSVQPTGNTSTGNGGTFAGGPVLADNYLQGTYAFMLRGFDNKQPAVITGSMTLDGNGNVTAGEEDITRGASASQALPISSGSYAVGITTSNGAITYNRGCVQLTTSAGTVTFDFTVGGCTNHYSEGGAPATSDNACGMAQNAQATNIPAGTFSTGRVIESNDGTGTSAQLSGILRAQDTSSFATGLSGPYAFGLGGWDSAQGHFAVAGSLQASSSALTAVAADVDDAGTLGSQLTGGSGTLAAADANGRISGSLTVGSAMGSVSLDLALYMVSQNEAFVVTTDPLSAAHPLLSGEAITTASTFSNASLQNSHMLRMEGLSSAGPDVSIGVLTLDGQGGVSGTVYEDQAGTLGTTSVSGAYSVDGTTGRANFFAAQGQTLGAHAFVVYLIPASANLLRSACSNPASCITGFLVGTDNSAQDGVLEFQTPAVAPPPPFTNRDVTGDYVYGTSENIDWMTTSFEGDVFATPSSSASTSGSLGASGLPFFQDASYGCLESTCPLFLPESTFAGAYTVNGSGTGTFGGGTEVSVTNGNVIFYIDESPVNLHPSVVVAEQ